MRYDLVVLGGGSAGVRCARIAAGLGAKVALVEASALGGTCVNVGCVPKKLMVYAAAYADVAADAAGYGWTFPPPTHDWGQLKRHRDAEVARLNRVYENLLRSSGVHLVQGWGRLTAPGEVRTADQVLQGDRVVLATGGQPLRPAVPGADAAGVSDDLFHWTEAPRRVALLGGGYIGVEFASLLLGLGVEVTLVHRGPHLLHGFDVETRDHLRDELVRRGLDLRLNAEVVGLERASGGLRIQGPDGPILEVDQALWTAGRVPRTQGLGLEELGVERDGRGAVVVDANLRSNLPWLWAAGDVLDKVALTPTALADGMWLARHFFANQEGPAPTFSNPPTAVFSHPPLATVGLDEDTARRRGPIHVYTSTFRPMRHILAQRPTRTFLKMVVDANTSRVLGVHIVGDDAPEMVQLAAVALTAGATKAHFDATLGIHPTVAEELVTLRERTR